MTRPIGVKGVLSPAVGCWIGWLGADAVFWVWASVSFQKSIFSGAPGFQLISLERLCEVKSGDPWTDLLTHLVRVTHAQNSSALAFAKSWPNLNRAARSDGVRVGGQGHIVNSHSVTELSYTVHSRHLISFLYRTPKIPHSSPLWVRYGVCL